MVFGNDCGDQGIPSSMDSREARLAKAWRELSEKKLNERNKKEIQGKD